MEWSKYNILFESKKFGYLIYNSLSNFYAELDQDTFNTLNKLKNNQNELKIFDDLEFLKEKKIVVESDIDEFNRMKLDTLLNRFDKTKLSLTIAPTQNCNFNCSYCFENNRINLKMDKTTQDNLIEFIKKFKGIEYIHITWYGGEPLIEFETVESLSNSIKELGINFDATLITNGYLLDDKKIKILDKINIKTIQITIDGLEESHDKRRCLLNGNPTYQTIYKNIERLVELNPDIDLHIRVNVDHINKDEFAIVYNDFTKKYQGKRVFVYPAFVTDYSSGCNSDCLIDLTEQSKYLVDMMKNYNIYNNKFYPVYDKNSCTARSINSFLIGPDGGIYKCWNVLGESTNKIGNINKQNNEYNSLLTAKYLLYEDYLDDIECKTCNLFPICYGGCPFLRFLKKDENNQINNCHLAKENIEEFLELHYQYIKSSREKEEVSNK